MPNNMNLHRNIFFKDCKHIPPAPFSSLDSTDPSELWKWMDGQRNVGNELLAISHNANLSDGRMYPTEVDLLGRPIDRAYAEDRIRNEPSNRTCRFPASGSRTRPHAFVHGTSCPKVEGW